MFQGTLEIEIYGDIDGPMADRVWRQVELTPHAREIILKIDSLGGDFEAASSIYMSVRHLHRAKAKSAVILGNCSSGALLVALAADRRIARRGTTVLMHSASTLPDETFRWTAEALRRQANYLEVINDYLIEITCQRTGADRDIIAREMQNEEDSSFEWCVEHGLISEIMEGQNVA